MGPLGAESAAHGVRYIVRYSRRVCRSKSLKKALLTGPMSVISLDSGGEDTRHSTHTHPPCGRGRKMLRIREAQKVGFVVSWRRRSPFTFRST